MFDEYLQVTQALWEGLNEAVVNDEQLQGISLTEVTSTSHCPMLPNAAPLAEQRPGWKCSGKPRGCSGCFRLEKGLTFAWNYMDSEVVVQTATKVHSVPNNSEVWEHGEDFLRKFRLSILRCFCWRRGHGPKLISLRVRIASSPSHKGCVKMGPSEPQLAGRCQMKVVCGRDWWLRGFQLLPSLSTPWAKYSRGGWMKHTAVVGGGKKKKSDFFLCDETLVSGCF